jgi:hypothetical protein
VVAVATAVIYFIVAYAYPHLVRGLPRSRFAPWDLWLVDIDGKGILREALAECARRGFSITRGTRAGFGDRARRPIA